MAGAAFWSQARRWLRRLAEPLGRTGPEAIPDALWRDTLQRLPFLDTLGDAELERLRDLSARFLAAKEFHGARGLEISDAIALGIAVQACLPLLHWGEDALDWYEDFVGIVVHPDEVLAPREAVDEAGVVHRWAEPLIGEAMQGGPVMLAWSHVIGDAAGLQRGHNLVIHEFAHKLDMHGKPRGAPADGCPQLPAGFMGLGRPAARRLWQQDWNAAWQRLREQVELAQRFGEPPPWLDAYAAQAPAEFFAVACEAYWVARARFAREFPELAPLLDAFFRRPPA
ncbi:MAG: hypothetical protein RJA36_2600 [Pseudomonadota bacterium]|jgi:Mlc titration factor MtfA (ptsG expression regulator)